jgi:AmmeMemoRadiSam system protein B
MSVRKPTAIGFYPGTKDQLISSIESCFKHKLGPGKLPEIEKQEGNIMGGISPHAGYVYSGPIAANLFFELAKQKDPDTVIVLGLSHGGYAGVAISKEGSWQTPLGEIKIDTEAAELVKETVGYDEEDRSYIVEDDWPHASEHSLEVQIPFLQYIYGSNFKLLPIVFGGISSRNALEIGRRLSKVINNNRGKIIIIASTDLTHYGSLYYGFAPVGDTNIDKILEWMKKTDGEIIKSIENLEPEMVYEYAQKTTMCGYIPVSVIVSIAKTIGVKESITLKYATSYDVKGSRDAIVGYLSSVFKY